MSLAALCATTGLISPQGMPRPAPLRLARDRKPAPRMAKNKRAHPSRRASGRLAVFAAGGPACARSRPTQPQPCDVFVSQYTVYSPHPTRCEANIGDTLLSNVCVWRFQ